MDDFTNFELRMRMARDSYLLLNSGRTPRHPLSGEDVASLSAIAQDVGFTANHEVVSAIAEFCELSNPLGEDLFLADRFEMVVDAQAIESFRKEDLLLPGTLQATTHIAVLTALERLSARLVAIVVSVNRIRIPC